MQPICSIVAAILMAANAQVPALTNLDAHLAAWEKKTKSLENFHSQFQLNIKDAVFKRERSYSGTMLVMKPNLARMRREDLANPRDYEAWIWNEKAAY
jgi:TIGR03009 family protein